MEIPTTTSFLDYYHKVRQRTERLLAVIPPDVMDWTFAPGKFTVADQIRHIAAIERNMFAETFAGRPSRYTGCGKELADGRDAVMDYFRRMHAETVAIIGSLTSGDLQRKSITPGNAAITTWKWMRSLTEHEIHHRAQLYMYLAMLEIKTPPIFGLTSEEVAAQGYTGDEAPLR
ncbi:DinB family protein [Chitinophaga solisilvae]|uniref:DinB family protein n=1 Tax=Chitinophaga solisilvae TaxID=1233460 RepID=UPI00136C490E|nr:DinB family protein [Chitinophaga solisilvae]